MIFIAQLSWASPPSLINCFLDATTQIIPSPWLAHEEMSQIDSPNLIQRMKTKYALTNAHASIIETRCGEFSSDAKINLNWKIKSVTGEAFLTDVLPNEKTKLLIYGEPYESGGQYWIDYLPAQSRAKVLKRLRYKDFLKSKLSGFQKSVEAGESFLVPVIENGKVLKDRFSLATGETSRDGRLLITTGKSEKYLSSYPDMFFWNGHLPYNSLDTFIDFFKMGGKGEIIRLSDIGKSDGYYLLLDKIPTKESVKNIPVLNNDQSIKTIAEAQDLGAKVLLARNGYSANGIIYPEKSEFVNKVDQFGSSTHPAHFAIVLMPSAHPGTVVHEFRHALDQIPHGNSSFYELVGEKVKALAINRGLTAEQGSTIKRFMIEQRAYADEIRTINFQKTSNTLARDQNEILDIRDELDRIGLSHTLTQLEQKNRPAYHEIKELLQAFAINNPRSLFIYFIP